MADLSGLNSRVLMALTSAPAQKINFYISAWQINALAFVRVYAEIVKHMFVDGGIDIGVGELPEGAGAKYEYKDDAYTFKRDTFGTTVLQQATIIHESVHAWIDLQGYVASASQADNEAAAYITESLFCFYATNRGSLDLQNASRLTWDVTTVRAVADRIALSIKDTPGARVSDQDRRAMGDAVIASPVYQRNKTTKDAKLRANGISQRTRLDWYPVHRH